MTKHQRHFQVIRRTLFIVSLSAVAALVPMIFIVFLGYAGLLDLTTIVSVGVTEVGISFLLYYVLGQGRPSHEEKLVIQMDAAEKFSHLNVYTFSVLKAKLYYVENTTTKECYKAPDFIADMTESGVIAEIPCKNEEELKAILAKNNTHPNETKPSIIQLMAKKRKRKLSPRAV